MSGSFLAGKPRPVGGELHFMGNYYLQIASIARPPVDFSATTPERSPDLPHPLRGKFKMRGMNPGSLNYGNGLDLRERKREAGKDSPPLFLRNACSFTGNTVVRASR
jgi:hypothetical protein